MTRLTRFALIGVLVTAAVACARQPDSMPSAPPDSARAAPTTVESVPVTTLVLRAAPTESLAVHRTDGRAPVSPLLLLPLPAFLLVGALRAAVNPDRDTNSVRDTLRQEFNKLRAEFNYFAMNGLMSTTVATLPACARATTASKVKTTNATVTKHSGVANAVGATDNAWTLTGADIAIGAFRRYLLLVSAADAFTVQASTDAATAALCTWTKLPADGLAIVGILTIQNATNLFTPGTTLLSAAGVTDTYIDGYDDSVFLSAPVNA